MINRKTQIFLLFWSIIILPLQTVASPAHKYKHPGFSVPKPDIPQPGYRVSVLPDLATAVIVGGLTYWVVDNIYYQKQGAGYVVVDKPVPAQPGMQTLDFDGKRYYIRDGHYYVLDINGQYSEVPRPAGL